MAKRPRKSINDALAEISAQGERNHVVRDHVPVDVLPRLTPAASEPPIANGYSPDGYRIRVRREKPHVSLYAHPKVFAVIRELATAQRRKPHDLYLEGLRLMLARYGHDFDALDRGEG